MTGRRTKDDASARAIAAFLASAPVAEATVGASTTRLYGQDAHARLAEYAAGSDATIVDARLAQASANGKRTRYGAGTAIASPYHRAPDYVAVLEILLRTLGYREIARLCALHETSGARCVSRWARGLSTPGDERAARLLTVARDHLTRAERGRCRVPEAAP